MKLKNILFVLLAGLFIAACGNQNGRNNNNGGLYNGAYNPAYGGQYGYGAQYGGQYGYGAQPYGSQYAGSYYQQYGYGAGSQYAQLKAQCEAYQGYILTQDGSCSPIYNCPVTAQGRQGYSQAYGTCIPEPI